MMVVSVFKMQLGPGNLLILCLGAPLQQDWHAEIDGNLGTNSCHLELLMNTHGNF